MELTTWNLPVLALRGLTVFPHMTLTFDVERPISIAALERAMEADQDIFLVTQREIGVNAPEEKDLYTIGTVSHITQILRLGQSSVRVMVEGRQRAHLRRLWQTEPFLQANVEAISEAMRKSPRTEALLRQTYALFGEYAEQASGVPEEVVATVMDSRDPGFLADYIAQNIALRYTDKQEILEEFSPFARLRKLNGFLVRENNVLGFEHEMESKVRDQLVRTQRDQILRTQIRVLQNELGETDDGDEDEIESYRQEILALELPEETEQHLLKEVNKLAKQPFGSAEGAVIRNYLDVCLEMPWNTTTKERVSVDAARRVLEKDHFGLEKVKERILETIAVRQMNPDVKGQILCLVGPPGVGKTSIAMSMAKAIGSGIPVGAFAMTEEVAKYSLQPGDHGATYGGNPLACTAVKTVIEIFEREDLVGHVNQVAPYLTKKLDELVDELDCVVKRKGKGLMQGIEITKPLAEVNKKTIEEGLLIIQAQGNVIRFVPPLIVEEKHIDEMIEKLKRALA